jgi:transcriptional regulator with XRE-family HTH domain
VKRLVHRRQLLKQAQIAEQFGVTRRTLERWRANGKGPPFVKLDGRIRYDADAVDAYLDACVLDGTDALVLDPPIPECIDRVGVGREQHTLDKDDRCVFCDRVYEPAA